MAGQKSTRRGFTVAEMLVALAVMAILLTAAAVALNASATNYNDNTDIFNAINTARQAMMRMTSQLRTAWWVKLPSDEVNTRCTFLTADAKDFRFCYHADVKTLYLHPLDSSGHKTADHVLCRNVTAMTFTRTMGLDSHNVSCVKSVQMSMTITVGDRRQTINSAVVLRKNL